MTHLLPAAGRKLSGRSDGSPLVPVSSSPMFVDEAERFRRDTAAAEQQRRQANLNKQEERIDSKRAANYSREGQRLSSMQSMERREQESLQQRRDSGTGNRRNQSLQHYNVFTLEYKSTPGGAQLQHQDSLIAQQQRDRSKMLYEKVNRVTHNIITGEALAPRPAAPQAARQF